MKWRTIMLLAAVPPALAVAISPAAAQGIPVFDTSTYVQALTTVQHTATMIQQGEQQIQTATNMLSSLQKLTNVNQIASNLYSSATRNILPTQTMDASTLLGGDLTKLGSLGTLASSIQSKYTISPSSSSSADAAYAQALKDSTGQAATLAALGQNTLSLSQTRMQGLDQLRAQLDTAKDPKDVMDLNARIAVEQAQLQNDVLKMQAIKMAQEGQSSLSLSSTETAAARDADASFNSAILRK